MGIIETIERIRKKPEHIRLRYVWFFVSICMFLIIFIWFFSLKTDIANLSTKNEKTEDNTGDLKKSGTDFLEGIKSQQSSLQNNQENVASGQ